MIPKVDRFTRILKTREKLREEEQIRLRDQRNEEEGLLHKLSFLNVEKKTAFDKFLTVSVGTILSTQEIWFHRQVVDVIDKNIDTESTSLNSVRKKIADTETRLLEKHRDVQVIDRHIDNLVKTWKTEIQFIEQQEIDDIACIRFSPKEDQ
jgi:flagellar export protein FliJ